MAKRSTGTVCALCHRPITGGEPWISLDDRFAHSECEALYRDIAVLEAARYVYEALMDE